MRSHDVRRTAFRAVLFGAVTLMAVSDVAREALAQAVLAQPGTSTADVAYRLLVPISQTSSFTCSGSGVHAVLAALCPLNGTSVGSCSVNGACSVMKASDCAAKNGLWFGGTSCVDQNCTVNAFAAHNTVPFQIAYGLSDGTIVGQYAAAMTLGSWSVTSSSGQSIATGTSAAPLGYPIVINGQAQVPAFTVAMSLSSAILDGQAYKVAVQAKDPYGRSCNAVSNLTGQAPGLAVPPSALAGSSSSSGVALSWTAPDPRYYVVTRYNVYRSTAANGPWTGVAAVTPSSYTVPASALIGVAGTLYFGVASVNAVGVGPLSSVVAFSVAFPPAVPTGLTANVGTASTATAGFADLVWNGSPGATSYSVRVSPTSGGPYTTSQTVSATQATIPGLTIGQTYYFVIVAINPAGSSAPTAPVTLLAKKYLP